jgi:hypothetical protein
MALLEKPVFWAFPECGIDKRRGGQKLMNMAGLSLFQIVPRHPR